MWRLMERYEDGVQFDSPGKSTQSQVATLASSGESLLPVGTEFFNI